MMNGRKQKHQNKPINELFLLAMGDCACECVCSCSCDCLSVRVYVTAER